ncbi:DEAD/DEAH box helicase family protein [Streptomyces sp. NPDC018045]|uniref:DEAD/DEAH box helicase family protein n=1 Tax=Streptomyces sp. NPDC018045 TaxID=3365037 RepID=UPI0037B9492E
MVGLQTPQLWAVPQQWEGNTARQLLVPAGPLQASESREGRCVHNAFGRWEVGDAGAAVLSARLPVDGEGAVSWCGPQELLAPQAVPESYAGAVELHTAVREGGLRPPQAGALHAVIGYWYSTLPEPGLVVMPTGTGKAETMLAVLVACRPERLLVLVPSIALRDQIAAKFESLGILQRQEVVSPDALRPCVGRVTCRFTEAAEAKAFAAACNVVVTTPHVLHHCTPEARDALLSEFSHLIVDEAHHAPASTWTSVIRQFEGRRVLLFTATPVPGGRQKDPRTNHLPLPAAPGPEGGILYARGLPGGAEPGEQRPHDRRTGGAAAAQRSRGRVRPSPDGAGQHRQAGAGNLRTVPGGGSRPESGGVVRRAGAGRPQ